MKNITTPLSIAAALATFVLSSASAQLISYDGFNGSTVFNGGTGWSSDWDAGISFGSNLTYLDLQTTGNGAAIGVFTDGQSERPYPAQTNGTLWYSWVQNFTGTNSGPNNIRIMNGNDNIFIIGQSWDANTFKIYNGNFNEVANTGISIDGTHMVATSVNLATGVVNLYIDPTGLGSGLAPSSSISATWNPSVSIASLDKILSIGGTDTFAWDEVRIGTTWAAVSPVPEPATFTLLVIGGALAVYLRRRKVA